MVNVVAAFRSLLQIFLKLAGVEPRKVEIRPGTVVNFWVTTTKSENPSVVLVHGFGADAILTWMLQIFYFSLKSNYSLYIPDLLFFGGSTTTAGNRSPAFQAECIAAGLRKLGVERCVVVGLSYGGRVAFKMGELYPELVEAMVVCGFLDCLTESVSNGSLKKIGVRRWSDFLLPTTADGVKTLFTVTTHWLPPWIRHRIFNDYLQVMFRHRKEREEVLEALVIRDQDFTPCHYQQKIYLIWGDDDKLLPVEFAHNLKERLGEKAKLECIEKAGHLTLLERPWLYNAHLMQILASLATDQR